MPFGRWFMTDLSHVVTPAGFNITVHTDTACHLWLRHTQKAPQEHPRSLQKRGLLWMKDRRYCFVAYSDLEQNEVGDTTTHTFTWDGWLYCWVRYFYFWGQVAEQASPSNTCIFMLHYDYEPPLGDWHEFPMVDEEAQTWHDDTPFGAAWAADVSNSWYNAGNYLQARYYGNFQHYLIYRSYPAFDTSAIPEESTPFEGYIRCQCRVTRTNPWPYHVTLQSGMPTYPHIPCVKADYDKDHYGALAGSSSGSPIAAGEQFNITLNSIGLAAINKDGITKFCTRLSRDTYCMGVEEEFDTYDIGCVIDCRDLETVTRPVLWLKF